MYIQDTKKKRKEAYIWSKVGSADEEKHGSEKYLIINKNAKSCMLQSTVLFLIQIAVMHLKCGWCLHVTP